MHLQLQHRDRRDSETISSLLDCLSKSPFASLVVAEPRATDSVPTYSWPEQAQRLQPGWVSTHSLPVLLVFQVDPPLLRSFPSPATPATPSAPVIPFATRANKLTVQETLNGHLALPTSAQLAGSNIRVALASSTNPKDYDYRIAYERPMERSEGELPFIVSAKGLRTRKPLTCFFPAVLDGLIDEAAQIFKEYYGIEEFGDPGIQSQVRRGHLLAVRQEGLKRF